MRAGSQDHGSLAIDVAVVGAKAPSWSVVVSSGLHGVEGFFGSAVQIACLRDLLVRDTLETLKELNGELVFLHSLNPFGFEKLRRANEDNVDLNRNFLLPGDIYKGAPDAYVKLNDFLNPAGAQRYIVFNLPKVLWTIGRLGVSALRQAIAEGQYDFPKGIFFGGDGPTRTAQIMQANMLRWICGQHVVHLDFHTGLGGFAKSKLLVTAALSPQQLRQYETLFGPQVECTEGGQGIAYKMRGDLGRFATAIAKDRDYHFLFVEFGTHSPVRICSHSGRKTRLIFSPRKAAVLANWQRPSFWSASVQHLHPGAPLSFSRAWKSFSAPSAPQLRLHRKCGEQPDLETLRSHPGGVTSSSLQSPLRVSRKRRLRW